jgi:hypothetical protein
MTSDVSPCDSALRRSVVLGAIFAIAIAMVGCYSEPPSSTTPKPSSSSSTSSSSATSSPGGAIGVGENVTLDASQFDEQQVTVAASELDMDRYIEAGRANDLLVW